ncbi:MAG: hypothetical protein Q8R92_05375 [Deltaproteobacteria bacterium]|nr:hypothetical protein [Deltaproteobacteria bacterium]
MSVRREVISITGPAGTAVSVPVSGEILEVRYDGTDLNAATATADYTLTRVGAGGTILALTDQEGPWQYAPREEVHTTAGAGGTAIGPIPVEGHLQLVIAQGGTATDDVSVFYRA